ncbi:hypothetical protein [Bifidobacterium margollesii]|uniref:hypothetical protein n=1 Tax=Bifidobacterium margollesii TaxID=2020964 RepID=UPI001055D01D|nr:hypothetical protein [Bifidobacterium margollesii]
MNTSNLRQVLRFYLEPGVDPHAPTKVYRLYNPKRYHKMRDGRGNGGGEHVYTTSYGEYLAVIRAGWRGEGVAWRSL